MAGTGLATGPSGHGSWHSTMQSKTGPSPHGDHPLREQAVQPLAAQSSEDPGHPSGTQGPSPGPPGASGRNHSPHCIPQAEKAVPQG